MIHTQRETIYNPFLDFYFFLRRTHRPLYPLGSYREWIGMSMKYHT